MKNKTFDEILRIESHNSEVEKQRRDFEREQEKKISDLENELYHKKREVEERYHAKIRVHQRRVSRSNTKAENQFLSKRELVKKIRLRTIVDHYLTDETCSYGYGQWKEEDVVKKIDSTLFTVTVLVEKSDWRKKINKVTLRLFVGFKYYYLSDYFREQVRCQDLFQKSFKTKEDALEWLNNPNGWWKTNEEKILNPLLKAEEELLESIKDFKYNVLEEFDFRGVRGAVARETLVPLSKTEATFSVGYDSQPVNVKYLGNGEFAVETDDKEFIKRLIARIEYGDICRIPERLIKIKSVIPA